MNTSVEEGVRGPPGVTGGCEPPDVGTGYWELGPLRALDAF